ncbi:hypothetical protein AAVH_00142 [Aphelenchoides avenae]|nr:hypothetical protein AAVH_00142 [Aphelenchus avenae]
MPLNGLLLGKKRSAGSSSAAVSATSTQQEDLNRPGPSTSKLQTDARCFTTKNGAANSATATQGSSDINPPPSKARRKAPLILSSDEDEDSEPPSAVPPRKPSLLITTSVSAAKKSGVFLNAQNTPTVRRLARRLDKEEASHTSGAAASNLQQLKCDAIADLVNLSAVQSSVNARPKRATKPPIVDQSDSASDAAADPSSNYDPHSEHVGRNDADDRYLPKLESYDMAVAATSSYTGEQLSYWNGTQIDSAQLTVFDCAPPSIPCKKVPKLKLFHELNDGELDNFTNSDTIKRLCLFCGDLLLGEGAFSHYFEDGIDL